jgi:hypothetical protein
MTAQPQPRREAWPICSKCRQRPAREAQRWCRQCASAYERDYKKRGVPRAFQRWVRARAKELGVELPAAFFTVSQPRK